MSSSEVTIFHWKLAIFATSRKTDKKFHFNTSFLILPTIFESLEVVLIIIFVHEVIHKMLSRDSNYIVDMVI